MQGSLVYHYKISLKKDPGPIKVHGRSFTTSLYLHLKVNFRKLLWIRKALKRGGWGSGLHFWTVITLEEYNIWSKQILGNKNQKLHKASKRLQCNWDFMNKIKVKIQCCPPTHPNQNFVDDWYVALDIILQDVKEWLFYFRSVLPMSKNGSVMVRENFWIV